MADKNITIKGLINFDTNQAQKSLNEISKSFTKIEKTSFNKMNDDFKKIANTIKGLDKDTYKFMERLSKRDAQDQLKVLNTALKEQTKLLKDAVNEQEALANAIAKTTDAKQKELLVKKRDEQISVARTAMGTIGEASRRKEELEGQTPKTGNNAAAYLKAAGITQIIGTVIKEAISHASGADFRRISYEAQGQSAPNKLASMMFSKNLDYGILAATGSLNRALNSSEKTQTGSMWARGVGGLTDIASKGLLGAAAGAAAGSILGPGGTLAGAMGGVAHGVVKAVDNNKDILDPATRKSSITAEKGTLTAEALESLRQKYAFAIDLANERIGLAPAKLAGAQAMAGYGSARDLSKTLSSNISTGWRYGYSIPESAALMQMNSGAGLIGAERTNIGPMALMERAGLASPGETADMARKMGSVAVNQQSIMKMFEQAMTKGVQTGIEKSLVKDLVVAAESLAEGGTARIDSLDNIMKELRTALGGVNANEVGRQDILESQSALNRFRSMRGGANNPMGMAIQTLGIQEGLKSAGIDVGKLPTGALMSLTTAKSQDEVLNNPSMLRELVAAAGGDESKVSNFLKDVDLYKNIGVLKQFEGVTNAGNFSSIESLKTLRAGFGKKATKEQAAYSRGEIDKFILSLQAMGMPLGEAQKFANMAVGQELAYNPEGRITNAVAGIQEYRDVKFTTAMEGARESLRGKKEYSEMISKGMSEQLKGASDFTKQGAPSLFDEGSPLVVQMGRLETAIRENTDAMERRQGYKTPQSPQGYNSPDELTIPERIRNAFPSFKPVPEQLIMPKSGQIKGP